MRRNIRQRQQSAVILAVVLVATSILLAGSSSVAAQSSPQKATLTVSPPVAELDVLPGKEFTHKVKLTNSSDTKRKISVLVQNFQPKDEQGGAQPTDEDSPYQLAKWMTVSPKEATIEPNKDASFDVVIKPPNDAPPGGHFGAIVFSPANEGGGQVSVISQITSLILLRIPGAATEKLEIANVSVCKPARHEDPATKKMVADTTCNKHQKFFTSGGDMVITTRVRNSGNVQVQSQGKITIYNIFGQKVKTEDKNPTATFDKVGPKNVIPASVRRLDTPWKKGFPLGLYKVNVELSYGTQAQTLRAETSVWALPVVPALITIVVLVLGFLMFWLPRKRLKKAFKALTASE